MRFRFAGVVGLLAFPASTAIAQGGGASAHPSCTGVAADACQQAVDLFSYVAPLLGTSITGGNMTMGQGGTLGKRLGLIPHFTVGVRANIILGGFPELQQPVAQLPSASGPPAPRDFTTKSIPLGLPAVDAAINVFKGFPLALSNVGGVDLLLSAAYVPEIESGDVAVTPDSPLKIGYGLRVGLLEESLLIPGIGLSFMKRDLPTTTIVGTAGTATLTVQDLALNTTAWRLTASKSLLLFGVALGVGQDMYDASTSISANLPPAGSTGPFTVSQKATRMNYFGDLSMNLPFIKIVGTGGMVSGGEITTYNSFDKPADNSRIYGSAGIRFTF